MNKRILVTGGAGYVGSHTCKILDEKGFQPIIFDNLSTGNKSSLMYGEFLKGELRRKEEIDKVLKTKPKFVIHLAALADIEESNKNPSLYYSNNVSSTINLLNTMRTNNIKNIIFRQAVQYFGNTKKKYISEKDFKNPVSPYAYTKYICEKLIENSTINKKIKYVVLRYFNAAGANSSGTIGEKRSKRIIPQIVRTF